LHAVADTGTLHTTGSRTALWKECDVKKTKDITDEPQISNDMSAATSPYRSLADRMTALQEAADEVGPVDPHFDQKSFFDVL
jgi:hypothetical protein